MRHINNIKSRGRPCGSVNPTYPLNKNQVHALFNACVGKHGLRNRAIVALCLYSGCRIGTAVKLLTHQLVDEHGKVRPSFHMLAKNEKSRRKKTYYIAKRGQSLIQDFINSIDILEDEPMFPSSRTGGFISPSSASRMITVLLERANIRKNSSHCLRSTFITTLYTEKGIDLLSLSMLAGHQSVECTKLYVKGLEPNIQAAMDTLSY